MVNSVVVHGGASSSKSNSRELNEFANKVADESKKKLNNGCSSVDVVESAVRKLEAHEGLNAGYGSKLQLDGVPRPEAGIMKNDLSMGVAIGLENVKFPVSVARIVMDQLRNNFISAPYSIRIAEKEDIEMDSLVTQKRAKNWWDLKDQMSSENLYDQVKNIDKHDPSDGGTVGCVAVDNSNNLCAATSTGGRLYQSPNRVGDSPIVGCGFYCDDNIAVSTTGVGESIMKTQLAKRMSNEYKNSKLKNSAQKSLDFLDNNTDGSAGLIAVNSNGKSVAEYNTESMIFAKK